MTQDLRSCEISVDDVNSTEITLRSLEKVMAKVSGQEWSYSTCILRKNLKNE